ncbi:MAG: bifunctional demethylmenaquinone methyltransferase/2-methoxy-6-polyprenyl-1,4-benzoquinol methylase UbiE [Marinilabiliaceae bacterium]|nr:bifunctional demethylmenaquinone methyltransferase/2-methoxy-6-polyprenyl-1,4-benzoquinol methylase UbiE [Marinilabiliaceae bacterium]
MNNIIKPYNEVDSSKKSEVEQMFNTIAPKYDLLNHLLSLGIDRSWRNKAIESLSAIQPLENILDVATGTGDMAIKICKKYKKNVVGTDLTAGMLEKGNEKVKAEGLDNLISLMKADSEDLPFDSDSFDAVTVAFGVRNYGDLDKGLSEMSRVLRKGGRMTILEFSRPRRFPMKQLYLFYFRYILPMLGGLISKDRRAYEYLPESVLAFPDGEEFEKHLMAVGMNPIKRISLTCGIATIYISDKI